jgi:hypothetical protein
MPHLFCTTHGEKHGASCREDQEEYRRLGETVVIVRGTLISGPWHCDRCNARLKKGDTAWLMTAFPSYYAEQLTGYDYRHERQYFRVERAIVKVYGAISPGGIPGPAAVQEEC